MFSPKTYKKDLRYFSKNNEKFPVKKWDEASNDIIECKFN